MASSRVGTSTRATGSACGAGHDALQDRQGEGRRLAGAGGGLAEQVAAGEERRDRLGLDRRRLLVAQGGQGTEQLGAQPEVGERGHVLHGGARQGSRKDRKGKRRSLVAPQGEPINVQGPVAGGGRRVTRTGEPSRLRPRTSPATVRACQAGADGHRSRAFAGRSRGPQGARCVLHPARCGRRSARSRARPDPRAARRGRACGRGVAAGDRPGVRHGQLPGGGGAPHRRRPRRARLVRRGRRVRRRALRPRHRDPRADGDALPVRAPRGRPVEQRSPGAPGRRPPGSEARRRRRVRPRDREPAVPQPAGLVDGQERDRRRSAPGPLRGVRRQLHRSGCAVPRAGPPAGTS